MRCDTRRHRHVFHRLLACITVGLLTPLLPGQGPDPQPPSGGFELNEQLNQSVTYGDGAKSLVDVRFPKAAPGKTGWPVVVVVHALTLNRKIDSGAAVRLARLGYLTVIYDVRGHGDFLKLNKAELGTQVIGKAERLDLVEIVNFVRKKYGTGTTPVADMVRLGIAGRSQGGAHAWAAAAWSGRRLPANSRKLTWFPTFKVACPSEFPPLASKVVFPDRASMHNLSLAALFLLPTVRFEKQLSDRMKGLVNQEKYAEAAAIIDNDPFRQDLKLLTGSQVPVLAMAGWNDTWAGVDQTLAALAAMPATTPKRAVLDPSTAHDMPANAARDRANEILCERWLARFLKGDNNGVDTEAAFETGLIQPNATLESDTKSLQWTRQSDAWPPRNNGTRLFYLRQGGALSPYRPRYIEPAAIVDHKVAKGFRMSLYVQILGVALLGNLDLTTALKQAIPFDSEAHDTAPLLSDMEIAGAPVVRLQLDTPSTTPKFQVHASLFQVPPTGPERMLASGMAFLPAGNVRKRAINIVMVPIQVRLRKGDRIRLRVENLARRVPAKQGDIWVAPYFTSTSFQVHKGPARPSHLDLPVRPVVQPALATADMDVLVSRPAPVRYALMAPTGSGGSPYRVVFSLSGHGTGIPLSGSDPLRLRFDALTSIMLGVGSPVLVGGAGVVPASGTPNPTLSLSNIGTLPSDVRGLRLSTAAVVQVSGGLLATNPLDVFFR